MKFMVLKTNQLKQIVSAVIIILIVVFMVCYGNSIFELLKDEKRLESWIYRFGYMGFMIFILIQIFQVVIFFIPGEVVQIAGGYLYGAILGSMLSIIGIVIGSMICFSLAKILGQPLVESVMGKERMGKLKKLVNNRKSMVALFLLFLIPGAPKDALSYVAGLTRVNFKDFLVISLIARAPAIIMSSFIGANIKQKDYSDIIIAGVIGSIIFIVCIVKKNTIMKIVAQKYQKSEE